MEKISYRKLSELQKLILVALSEARYAVMKRRAFNRTVKRLYYGKDPSDNGVMLVFLAWGNNREPYPLLGLRGPPLEALRIKPANAGSNTERRGGECKIGWS